MGRQDDNVEETRVGRHRALVYVPCPACGSAVLLSDASIVADDPPTYECGTCGALVELRERCD